MNIAAFVQTFCQCKKPKPVEVTVEVSTTGGDVWVSEQRYHVCDRCGLHIQGKP